MNNTTEGTSVLQVHSPLKALLSMLLCLFFFLVNAVMMYALLRKSILLETSRYILFGHLLLADSLQLFFTAFLYILSVTNTTIITCFCVAILLFALTTLKMSPLSLAVMSLERYIAICYPLKHAHIATTKTTGLAVAVIWTMGSLDSIFHLFLFISLDNTEYTVQKVCRTSKIFQLQIYSSLSKAFIIVYFVIVSIIIIYTYVAILITVNSASTHTHKATKASKTVLLHLIQLGFCLTSTLFNMINSGSRQRTNSAVTIHIEYALFVGLVIFPKCLSPLIYGLRDQTLRQVFLPYFTFGLKLTVKTFPKT